MADLQVEGFEKLLDEVAKLDKKGAKIENRALRQAGEVVKDAIQNTAPVRTGALKKSIAVSRVKTKDGVKYVEIGPGKGAYYARFLEFGTVKMRAKPFVGPGFEASKDKAMAVIVKELKEGLGL